MVNEVQITSGFCCDKTFKNAGPVNNDPDSHGGGYEGTD